MKNLFVAASFLLLSTGLAFAQNSNSSTTESTTTPSSRTRTVAPPKPTPTPKTVTKSPTTQATPTSTERPSRIEAAGQTSPSGSVLSAFNNLLEGIRNADVKAVTDAYQNSPRLLLFNFNGTVTKGWEQMRSNRESLYARVTDVKLDVRDVRVTMLGMTAAFITCQWTQSMTLSGVPETDTGRMTIVFRKVGKDWKAVHLHTSPDNPDPSRVPPSEQATPKP